DRVVQGLRHGRPSEAVTLTRIAVAENGKLHRSLSEPLELQRGIGTCALAGVGGESAGIAGAKAGLNGTPCRWTFHAHPAPGLAVANRWRKLRDVEEPLDHLPGHGLRLEPSDVAAP